jgi:hypothetical protein
MDGGSADEAVVVVKPKADEDAVMHLRVKLLESDGKKKKPVGDEERNTIAI